MAKSIKPRKKTTATTTAKLNLLKDLAGIIRKMDSFRAGGVNAKSPQWRKLLLDAARVLRNAADLFEREAEASNA